MKAALIAGLFGEGGLLKVRAVLALALVIGPLVLLGRGLIETEVAMTLILTGVVPYGFSRAGK